MPSGLGGYLGVDDFNEALNFEMMIVPQVVLNPILENVNITASSVEPLKAEQKLFFEIPLGPIVQKIKL